jgi:hypothetical protein
MNTQSNIHKTFWKALLLGVTKIKTLPTLVSPSKNKISVYYLHIFEVRSGARWLRHCATNQKGAGSIPDGPRFDLSPNGNEYQGYVLGVKESDA